jgi:hypothetical protein
VIVARKAKAPDDAGAFHLEARDDPRVDDQ